MTTGNHPPTERPAGSVVEESESSTNGASSGDGTGSAPGGDGELPEERLLADLRRVAEGVEGPLTEREYADRGRYGVTTYRRRFGSWNAAKRAAGLDTVSRAEVTEDRLVSDLRRVAGEVEGRLSEREYADRGRYGVTTYRRRFGSWNGAKRAAGLRTYRRSDLTDEALADDLARVVRETDAQYVTPAVYEAEGRYLLSDLPDDRAFWEGAFGRFGLQISPLYHRFVSGVESTSPRRN